MMPTIANIINETVYPVASGSRIPYKACAFAKDAKETSFCEMTNSKQLLQID